MMRFLNLILLHVVVALPACTGSISSGDDGGGPPCPGDADCGGADPCAHTVCPPGQGCSNGRCVVDDLCEEVVCSNPGEVCDPRNGACVSGAADDDGDGYTIAEGDCNDSDAAVHPGVVERCDGLDQDCDRLVDDDVPTEPCSTACGTGELRCVETAMVCSVPETCECTPPGQEEEEPCGHCGSRSRSCGDDYAWTDWSGCTGEGECAVGTTGPCTTSCGSAGTHRCDDRCTYGACEPPAESCNGTDDDCDGSCDEGCRHRIYRCYSASQQDHFYTPDVGECSMADYIREPGGDFYLYTASVPDTSSFWQCWNSGGEDHFYTTHSACEDAPGWRLEESIGYIGSRELCGAVPLYRMVTVGNHFYTTGWDEVEFAESLGYTYEFIAGYVWRD